MRFWFQRYSLKELSGFQLNRNIVDKCKIAIVDDEPFLHEKELRSSGYRITVLEDVLDIKNIEAYHIIICDVNGVGIKMSPELQGLGLVDQIQKLYPEKSLGIYSGATYRLTERRANVMSFQKDDDVEKWKDKIDSMISDIADPRNVWKRIAHHLVENQIPSETQARLESEFVKSIIKKKSLSSFPKIEVELTSCIQFITASINLLSACLPNL